MSKQQDSNNTAKRNYFRAYIYIIATVMIQILYVNFTVIAISTIWDYLPKYLNVFLLLFVGPPVLAAGIAKIIEIFFRRYAERVGILMMLVVTSITLWLPGIYPGLFHLKDYIQIERMTYEPRANLLFPEDYDDAGFVKFDYGRLNIDFHKEVVSKTRHKSGDTYTDVYLFHHVVPIVDKDWTLSEPVTAWACSDDEKPYYLKEGYAPGPVQGLVIREAYDVATFNNIIAATEKEYGLNSVKKPLLVKADRYTYEELVSKLEFWVIISLVIMTLIWTAPVVYAGIQNRDYYMKDVSYLEDNEVVYDNDYFVNQGVDVEGLQEALISGQEKEERVSAAEELAYAAGDDVYYYLNKALLGDRDWEVREAAAWAIWSRAMSGDENDPQGLLESLKNDPHEDVRYAACKALIEMTVHGKNPTAYEALLKALKTDHQWNIRTMIIDDMNRIEPIKAVEFLIDALQNDEHPMVRERAAEVLGEMGSETALPILKKAAESDADEYVREAAQKAISSKA